MALYLGKETNRSGLTVNINKIQFLHLIGHHPLPNCINGQNIEGADSYLTGSVICARGGIELGIVQRMLIAIAIYVQNVEMRTDQLILY